MSTSSIPFLNRSIWRRPGKDGAARIHEILASIEEVATHQGDFATVLRVLDACRKPLFDCLNTELEPVTAKAVTLKVLNLCLAKYHYRSRHSEVLSRPFGLIIDPSNFCNLACPGCVHSSHVKELKVFNWPTGLMPQDRMTSLYQTHGLFALQTIFCNYGEPLMNPDTPRLIRTAKSYLMGTMLSTNISIGKLDAEALVMSGLDYMVVSIDGATQAVYEKFRRNGNLEVVFRNVRALVEAKRKLGRRTPVIAWHFLMFEHNVHEIPQALEMARQMGVNQFATLTPFDVSWDDPGVQPSTERPMVVKIDSDSEASIARNLTNFPGGLDQVTIDHEFSTSFAEKAAHSGLASRLQSIESPMTCHWLYKSMSMDSRGRVFPCCGAPANDRDLVFAQFDNGSSPDPYNSSKYRLSRLSFANMDAYKKEAAGLPREPYCADCEWQKETPNTDVTQIQQFFKAVAPDLFSPQSVGLLSHW